MVDDFFLLLSLFEKLRLLDLKVINFLVYFSQIDNILSSKVSVIVKFEPRLSAKKAWLIF